MRHLITLQIVGLACTNLFMFSIGDISLTAGLVFMFIFVPVSVLALAGYRIKLYGLYLVAMYMVAVVFFTMDQSRMTSLCYSMLFLACFVLLMNASCRWYDARRFGVVLKVLLIAYFVNIVLTQIIEGLGLGNEFTRLLFQINVDERYNDLRYQGFSSEPSYAAFICIVAYMGWSRLCTESSRSHVLMAAMLVYTIVSLQSVYGYLMIAPALIAAHSEMIRHYRRLAVVVTLVLAIGLGAAAMANEDSRLGRILGGAIKGELLDPAQISALDSSTFIRVGIFLQYILSTEVTDPKFYFGHGAMAHSTDLAWEFRGHLQVNEQRGDYLLRPGFNIGFLYDYGVIGSILVLVLLLSLSLRSIFSVETLIVVMMLFNANFNTLLFWFVITVFAACKMFMAPRKTDVRETIPRREAVGEAGHAYRC